MLILTRKIGQSITLDVNEEQSINIVILDIDKDRMKIGIQAPKEINICRDELFKKNVKNQNNKNPENFNKKIA